MISFLHTTIYDKCFGVSQNEVQRNYIEDFLFNIGEQDIDRKYWKDTKKT